MRKCIEIQKKIPSWALSWLEYGEGEYTEEEREQMDAFWNGLSENAPNGYVFGHIDWGKNEPSFEINPEFGLPSDCFDAFAVYFKAE